MLQGVKLKRIHTTFTKENCIICLKSGEVKSTENGRQCIINAAAIRKDDVLDRINSLDDKNDFVYHMSNQCYKTYTLKKTLNKVRSFIMLPNTQYFEWR